MSALTCRACGAPATHYQVRTGANAPKHFTSYRWLYCAAHAFPKGTTPAPGYTMRAIPEKAQ